MSCIFIYFNFIKIYLLHSMSIFQLQTIVGKAKTSRKLGIGGIMQTYLMSNVSKVGLLSSYPARHTDGISHQLMTMMRLIEAKRIDHQGLRHSR